MFQWIGIASTFTEIRNYMGYALVILTLDLWYVSAAIRDMNAPALFAGYLSQFLLEALQLS